MRVPFNFRVIQIASALGLFALGALGVAKLRGDFFDEGYIVGLVALAGGGVALGRISLSPENAAGAAQDPREDPRERAERDRKIETTLAHIAKVVHAHVADNAEFNDRLDGANKRLSQHARGPLNEIVMALIEDNRQMQDKLLNVSGQLEESRSRIQQLQSNLARAEEVGQRDTVTGIGNRRFFDLALAEEIANARASSQELCVALGDLDNFKRVNDSFGHLVGDRVLRLFADVLVKSVKGQDKVARFGGEEFALVFPNTRLEDAATVVEHIRKTLEAKKWVVESSGQRIGAVTVSFGVGRLCPTDSAADLLRRVDARLYEAKSAGRNRVAVDTASVAHPAFAGATRAIA